MKRILKTVTEVLARTKSLEPVITEDGTSVLSQEQINEWYFLLTNIKDTVV